MTGITYREDFGLYWPDYDHAPERCHKKVMAQVGAVDCTIRLCRAHNLVVQAGGHCGVWPRRLSEHFKAVHTHEPDPYCYQAMARNLGHYRTEKGPNLPECRNVYTWPWALGSEGRHVMMKPHRSAGGWRVADDGTVDTICGTIDRMNLDTCDAIVLDVEGYEAEVLKGAVRTIEKFRPILHLEVLDRARAAIEEMIGKLGYRFHIRIHADEIYLPA